MYLLNRLLCFQLIIHETWLYQPEISVIITKIVDINLYPTIQTTCTWLVTSGGRIPSGYAWDRRSGTWWQGGVCRWGRSGLRWSFLVGSDLQTSWFPTRPPPTSSLGKHKRLSLQPSKATRHNKLHITNGASLLRIVVLSRDIGRTLGMVFSNSSELNVLCPVWNKRSIMLQTLSSWYYWLKNSRSAKSKLCSNLSKKNGLLMRAKVNWRASVVCIHLLPPLGCHWCSHEAGEALAHILKLNFFRRNISQRMDE